MRKLGRKLSWLITGCSRGLGMAMAERVLAEGDLLLATARDTSTLEPLARRFPQTLKRYTLDVTDAQAADDAVSLAVEAFGGLDVLVNNAGYGHIAPFEQVEADDFRAQIEANLFGVVNLTRAVLPIMRSRRAGHIINISSIGGRIGAPGLTAYQSAKWAVSGFTESLSQETGAFGVKVISIEPGGMRTDWGATARGKTFDILADYESTVGAFLARMDDFVGQEVGDPAKIAGVIFDLSRRQDLPQHLILGSDALAVFERGDAARRKAAEEWLPVSRSVDVDNAAIS
ncbi:SDR family NAD(P)-dependent oxidoreductase [Sphingomonas sp. NBWT7]|nr:SDR family NAD(P)-dependent oxidoreductase [Sphingomonas sp. NBWT7]